MPKVGNKLLPSTQTRIAPEYLSEAQGYPNSAPQMADFVTLKNGKFGIDENKLKDIVRQGGATWKGISDMGERGGKWLMFDEPSGSTLALPLNEVSVDNIKAKVSGFAKKLEVRKNKK